MSSKADDFDVRYREMRNDRPQVDGAGEGYANGDYEALAGHGVLRSAVDYDLGYDANGWDTQGFRSPEAGYADSRESGAPRGQVTDGPDSQATGYLADADVSTARRRGNGRAGSHARTGGQQDTEQLGWEPGTSTGPWIPEQPDQPGPGRGPGGSGGPGRRGPDRSPVKVKGSWWRHWTLRKALGVLLGCIGALIVLGAIAVAVAYEKTPVPTEAMAATEYAQSVVYSSNGTLIGRFGTTDRQMLAYDQIPRSIKNAVLAAEDRNFWTEGGISPTGILRAAFDDITGSGGSLQGGSTITQQFVRNYYQGIGTQQTLSRKLKEIFVAMKVGKEKSKQWILTNYLNTIYLGEGAYGIEAAAETYFGKPVSELSVAQDAVIAALIQQPSTYPLPQYRSQLEARWRYVLDGMVQMGTLSAQKAAAMTFPRLENRVPQTYGPNVWDPYIMYMIEQELRQVYHFSQSQIDNGGYVIKTSIDDAKMEALYQAVRQNEAQINASSVPFEPYMHVGAVLENPANGAIQALYPGPGYIGAKYNGTGPVITARECRRINCQWNMAYQNREQVGSSFKPYILAAAVKQGMDVKTSTLDGYDPLYIPPDTAPDAWATSVQADAVPGSHPVTNDSTAENGPFTPQLAMAASINTAYSDLWHKVAGQGSQTEPNNIGSIAQLFGVDTDLAGITGLDDFQDGYAVTLGVASLTVIEQGSMLATIDDNGVYHDPHLITSISQNGVLTPIKIFSHPVFSSNPTLNTQEDSQVQYAMSADTAPGGTAQSAAMSNGQEVIAKTGTTDTAQSAFFIGGIPSQALAVALFTSDQNGNTNSQTLNNLGGNSQGGYGGTWPAAIWHTYAENMFVPLGVEQFQPVKFTGNAWNMVPPYLRKVPKPRKKSGGQGPKGIQPPPTAAPTPTVTCNPQLVLCASPSPGTPPPYSPPPPFGGGNGAGHTQAVNAAAAGAAVGGVFAALPATCLWVRRRARKRGAKRG